MSNNLGGGMFKSGDTAWTRRNGLAVAFVLDAPMLDGQAWSVLGGGPNMLIAVAAMFHDERTAIDAHRHADESRRQDLTVAQVFAERAARLRKLADANDAEATRVRDGADKTWHAALAEYPR